MKAKQKEKKNSKKKKVKYALQIINSFSFYLKCFHMYNNKRNTRDGKRRRKTIIKNLKRKEQKISDDKINFSPFIYLLFFMLRWTMMMIKNKLFPSIISTVKTIQHINVFNFSLFFLSIFFSKSNKKKKISLQNGICSIYYVFYSKRI